MRLIAKVAVGIAASLLVIAAAVLLLVMTVGILNAELHGRITQTETVTAFHATGVADDSLPLIRVVLHRIAPDENAVEASMVLVLNSDDELSRDVRSGKTRLTAEVRDGSSIAPIALHSDATIDASAFQPGWSTAAVQSQHFNYRHIHRSAVIPSTI